MQQPRFHRRADEARARQRRDHPARWQSKHIGRGAGRIVAYPFGQKPGHSRKGDRGRRSERGAVKQVLPAKPARPLADVVEVEARPDHAGQSGKRVNDVSRPMRPRREVLMPMEGSEEREHRRCNGRVHRLVLEVATIVLHRAIDQHRGGDRSRRPI